MTSSTLNRARPRGLSRAQLAALATLLLSSVATPSLAWPEYPQVVADTLHLQNAPDCILCHTSDLGGTGTATKPFARTLEQFGLGAAFDPGLLTSALEQMESCQTDSDGDGVSDVDELSSNSDPNDGHGTPTSQCGEVYTGPLAQTGCSLEPGAPTTSLLTLIGIIGLATGLTHVRRKQRAQRARA